MASMGSESASAMSFVVSTALLAQPLRKSRPRMCTSAERPLALACAVPASILMRSALASPISRSCRRRT
jgi:hypothetical protein